MRRARRTPAITPELSTQQKISRLEATPPGWANLQTADGGAPLRIIRGRVDTGGPGIGRVGASHSRATGSETSPSPSRPRSRPSRP